MFALKVDLCDKCDSSQMNGLVSGILSMVWLKLYGISMCHFRFGFFQHMASMQLLQKKNKYSEVELDGNRMFMTKIVPKLPLPFTSIVKWDICIITIFSGE